MSKVFLGYLIPPRSLLSVLSHERIKNQHPLSHRTMNNVEQILFADDF